MRRIGAVERFAPGALERMLAAIDAPEAARARLRRQPLFAAFQRGGPAPRPAILRLRKALIAAQLSERVDHRSGAYAAAKRAAARALQQERSRTTMEAAPATGGRASPDLREAPTQGRAGDRPTDAEG